MRIRSCALVIPLLFAVIPVAVHGAPAAGVLYELDTPSQRLWGCHGPCACPEIASPVQGTFKLTELKPDPLFNNYAITDVQWVVNGLPGRWTGTGLYRVGGEVAVMNELVLDLEYDGQAHHYESGRVQGGGGFPRIDIAAAADTVGCFHDVFDIHAAPASASVDQSLSARLRASPNPFASSVGFEFTLRAPATVTAVVVDVTGRRVRELADHIPYGAGAQSMRWDGRDGDGVAVRPGIYRLRMDAGTEQASRTVARIR